MELTFCGANKEVTGSSVHLEHAYKKNIIRILLDCGMFQGDTKESYEKNASKSLYNPASLNAILISHAHVDHCGLVPIIFNKINEEKKLSNEIKTKIYSTIATAPFLKIMWEDALKIHKEEVAYLNKKYKEQIRLLNKKQQVKNKRGKKDYPRKEYKNRSSNIYEYEKRFVELFTNDDIKNAKSKIHIQKYDKWFNISSGVRAMFIDSGHILGSSSIIIEYISKNIIKRLFYTGDLGGNNSIILEKPKLPSIEVDDLIIESTYGDREREKNKKQFKKMLEKIENTLKSGGKVIVPAFALHRSQEFLMQIYPLICKINKDMNMQIPIYMDSPMAIKINDVFRDELKFRLEKKMSQFETSDDYDKDLEQYNNMINHILGAFSYDKLQEIEGEYEDKIAFVNNLYKKNNYPCIILSSSGMCDNGPIVGHLKNGALQDPKNLLLFIGYAEKNSRARKLQDMQYIPPNQRYITIKGEKQKVSCKIFSVDCFSGHADSKDLYRYVRNVPFKDRSDAHIFIVHGDTEASESLKELILKNTAGILKKNIIIPEKGDTIKLR